MATFFFDNDISFRIAHALRQLVQGDKILCLREEFPENTPDTVWIPEAGKNGWIVISRDEQQRRRKSEFQALKRNGVKALYIKTSSRGDALFADAARIIKNWPKIRNWAQSASPGDLAKLTTTDAIQDL